MKKHATISTPDGVITEMYSVGLPPCAARRLAEALFPKKMAMLPEGARISASVTDSQVYPGGLVRFSSNVYLNTQVQQPFDEHWPLEGQIADLLRQEGVSVLFHDSPAPEPSAA